jgi:Bacterial protein of unknown function (DUF885)
MSPDDHGLWSDAGTPQRFRRAARGALDVLLEHDPAAATALGDHRFDDRLPDWSPSAVDAQLRKLSEATGALDDLDDTALDPEDAVDLELLRTRLTARQWTLAELGEHRWNPLVTLPGDAIYPLVARDTGEPDERARCLAARLAAVPAALAQARQLLGPMSRVHVETAVVRASGAVSLLGAPVDALLDRAPGMRGEVDAVREVAARALREHAAWLRDRVDDADADPRLGEQAFAARLWYALDTETSTDALLDRAESDLMAVEDRLAELAGRLAPRLGIVADAADRPRAVLDALADAAPVGDHDVLDRCRSHLSALTELVRQHDLVTLPDETVDVIEMPEVHRGVAVAYCDAPGALEPAADGVPLPTFLAVAPAPSDWPAERVASFYREYNDHMLRDLTVHEAMPGHVLQLAHARRYRGSTPVRAALRSGPFVEGWAVYAEQLVADVCAAADPDDLGTLALRAQQLKMRLRSTINAVLDVRVHARGMTEEQAMALMTQRGHQEPGEAAGKWRRALLTSTQLSTYYVGAAEVTALVDSLRVARPQATTRAVHDALLAHGSPSPRLLRPLLGLD